MKLYLVQHGKAASKEIDPQRPLTEEGRKDVQRIAAFIKPLGLCVDCLWHSGKKRTAQTAEVLAEAVKINNPQTARDGLGPNDDAAALRDELASAGQDIMIVGHLPFLSKLASLLLSGSELGEIVAFKNGGVVAMSSSEENLWRVDWIVTPQLLT